MKPESSTNNKRIAKNTLFLYFRMFFIMAVNLYTSRVILKVLGVEDYGIYNVVGGVITMFAFLNSAMASATQRYLTFELGRLNTGGLAEVFRTSISIHIIIALIILILGETVGLWFVCNKMVIPESRMTAALWVYQCSVLSTMLMVVSVPYNAVIIAHERMSAFAYISIIEVLLKLGIVYLLCLFEYDKLKLYAILLFATQFTIRLIYGKYCNKHFKEVKAKIIHKKTLFKEMLLFAVWNLWGNLASVFSSQGTNILLNMFFGPSVNAARAISSQVKNAVLQFSLSFQTALNPQITKCYASNETERMHRLIYSASKYTFFLLLLITFPVIFNAPFILRLWLGEYPPYTVDFVIISISCTIIDAVANPLMVSSSAIGKIRKYQSVIGGILLCILPVSFFFLKLGANPVSVYFVQLCICLIAFFVRIFIVKPMIGLSVTKYLKEVIVRCFLVGGASVAFPLLIGFHGDGIEQLVFTSIFIWAGAVVSIYYIGLDKSERLMLMQQVSNVKNKINQII